VGDETTIQEMGDLRNDTDQDAMKKGDIGEKIRAFQGNPASKLNRSRSWEHCYDYFHRTTPEAIGANRDNAALQLGFYLASWGIYRGSSFLLEYDYTVHLRVIDQLVSSRFCRLWQQEFGAGDNDTELVPIIADVIGAVREAYRPFAEAAEAGPLTDTLVTKVILGTFGCLPACDWYAIKGLRTAGPLVTARRERPLEYSSRMMIVAHTPRAFTRAVPITR
jgi:hypothetical protein